MKKFLIRREMEGASNVPKAEFNKGGKASEAILEEMRNEGKMIQQEQKEKLKFYYLISYGYLLITCNIIVGKSE